MSKLNVADYQRIADEILSGEHIHQFEWESTTYTYHGVVVAKQRARTGKNGRHFTPKETRAFEASVAKWAAAEQSVPAFYPIRVRVTVFDQTDDKELIKLSCLGLTHYDKNDLDNIGKAILDGCNKTFYKDDKQIRKLSLSRRYAKQSGFTLAIGRAGLSRTELVQLRKFL